MKRMPFIAAFLLTVMLQEPTYAQKNVGIFNSHSVEKLYKTDTTGLLFDKHRMNNVKLKAVRDFMKWFKTADNVQWHTVPNGYIATFTAGGVETRVQYDAAGRRAGILKTFNEKSMPAGIRHLAKQQFYDHSILVAYEIDQPKGSVFMVKMINKASIKVLRIQNNEVYVQEDYVNATHGNG